MNKKPTVPDAWDDDWEALVDKQETAPSDAPVEPQPSSKKISKAERRAQQAEFNKQLWQEAEAPKTFHFLESRSNVPLKSEFKPQVTLLSRKPNQSNSPARKSNTALGMENLKVNDYEGDSEEEGVTKPTLTPEERRLQMQREHEEKQRKYDEARGRLFGTSKTGSGASTPGTVTPPRDGSATKGKGKGRSVGGTQDDARPASAGKTKQLYDAGYSAKPDSVYLQKREKGVKQDEEDGLSHPIRQPRQPDGTRGFHNRGGSVSRVSR